MDLILQNFLEQIYPALPDSQQLVFEQILDETDLDILDWIMGRSQPAKAGYADLISLFRQCKPEKSA